MVRPVQARTPVWELILSHWNMPNVRIASICSTLNSIDPDPDAMSGVYAASRDACGTFAMNDVPNEQSPPLTAETAVGRKPLSPAAQRALAEAEARRAAASANIANTAKEFQGPQGPEPTRFGDWERKGIASDF